jgi:hypothetical protein
MYSQYLQGALYLLLTTDTDHTVNLLVSFLKAIISTKLKLMFTVSFALHCLQHVSSVKHILILHYITIYCMLSDIDCSLPSEDDFLQHLSNDLEVWAFSLCCSVLFTLQ